MTTRASTMGRRTAQALAVTGLICAGSSASAVEFWLRAAPLTASMPGNVSVPMWGYASCTDGTFTTCSEPTVPGPALTVPVGDSVLTIHLKNDLPTNGLTVNNTSIVIPGQVTNMVPVKFTDSTGRQRVRSFTHEALAGGGVGDYSWTNMKPGTYLYHSGTHPQVQVQMGLYGSVKKDSAAGEAYPGFSYSAEVALLYSEIDPALHASVSAGTYDPTINSTLNYRPQFFLINGKPFVAGDAAVATLQPGQTTLLRFMNAGLQTRVPIINGLTMRMVAEDGNPYPWPTNPREQYSVLLPAAKTVDAVIVAQAAPGGATGRHAIYDHRMGLSNGGAADGGMLAFLDVAAAGSPPTFTSTPVTTGTEGVAYSYTLAATDPDGGTLTYSLDAKPVGMTVNASTGAIAWTPSATQIGNQAVSARVTDPTGLFATQSFTIAVADVNTAPVAQADAYTMIQGGTLNVAAPGVLGNDSDPDPGDSITAVNFSAPSNGTVTGNANGSFTYTPVTTFTGTATFTYQAQDAGGLTSNAATVSITVAANRPPVAVDNTYSAPVRKSGQVYTPQVFAVLANDSDPDTAIDPANTIAPATVAIAAAPNKGGSVTVNADGTISYTPKLNFKGTEVFKYTVRDTRGALSNAATVRVNVQ